MAKVKTYTLTLDAQELVTQNARWAAERYRREQEQKEAKKT